MKIGLAVCGNSRMSGYGRYIKEKIEQMGIYVDTISATSLASLSFCIDGEKIFSQYENPQKLVDTIKQSVSPPEDDMCFTAVDISNGKYIIISKLNKYQNNGTNMMAINLNQNNYDNLILAPMSPFGDIPSLEYDNMQLYDSAIMYGCPLIPLCISGIDKIITLTFPTTKYKYPYMVPTDKLIEQTSALATYNIVIEDIGCETWEKGIEYIDNKIDNIERILLEKILFY